MSDFVDGLVAYLRTTGPVFDLVGERVYPAELPAAQASSQPRTAVIVVPTGGAGPVNGGCYRQARVDVTCYGATPQAARLLWLAVDGALATLERAEWAGGVLHAAELTYGPVQTRHPETHWPLTWGSWQVWASARED